MTLCAFCQSPAHPNALQALPDGSDPQPVCLPCLAIQDALQAPQAARVPLPVVDAYIRALADSISPRFDYRETL